MRSRRKTRMLSSISILVGTILVLSSLLMAQAGFTGAFPAFQVIGDEVGLKVAPEGASWFEDIGNLNPGDTKESTIRVSNEGDLPFSAGMTMNRLDNLLPGQVDLLEQLEMKVTYRNNVIYDGPMNGFSTVNLGNYPVNAEEDIHFLVYFPGPETGNEYQGASATVQLVFNANRTPTPPPPGGDYVDIILVKEIVDEDGVVISGFAPHNTVPFTFQVNNVDYEVSAAGSVNILGQNPGQYTVSELDAPDGYTYVSGGGTFNFGPGTHTVTITNEYTETSHIDEDPERPSVPDEVIQVLPDLPRTGGPDMWLLVIGMALIVFGVVIERRNRILAQ